MIKKINAGKKESYDTFLDNTIPEIEILVLAIQLVISNQGELLIYFVSELFPVVKNIFKGEMTPEHVLHSKNILIISTRLFDENIRIHFNIEGLGISARA